MNIPYLDISGILAVQHRVLKDLKKKTGLRQRDWEVLCACQRLSLAKYPFTTAKVDTYLSGAYFLHCLYDSINLLLEKGYIRVVVEGKPFRPESYEMTYEGSSLVKRCSDEMRRLWERQEENLSGKMVDRFW
ncbi:hypothetical protein [Rufibacter latericius]|uniref:MarR family transcriptional regulator n=1 Tax=Rufibacter latericius TaxID=2487040 RepID=A0A3M9MUG5_9BACT|nr:hypothetical protein [Rufibacter latericius]RNI28845.1 hypothetical protein EFB08_09465 [Rufibacter latericius]